MPEKLQTNGDKPEDLFENFKVSSQLIIFQFIYIFCTNRVP